MFKMDHAKTMFPCFASKNKNIDSFMRLLVVVTSMIAHGHNDANFALFSLNLYHGGFKYMVGSIAKFFCDLENLLESLSRVLFEDSRSTSFFDIVLKEKEVCNKALDTALTSVPA